MIKRFITYKKYQEYFAKSFECLFAILGTIICIVLLYYFGYYENFSSYFEITNTVLISLLAGFIGTLALIFSGIAFWGSMFDEHFISRLMQYTGKKDVANRLFTSYLFLAFNILCHILYTLGLIIALNSTHAIIGKALFLICVIIYLYWTFFIMGYIVAIMRNCIDLIIIQNTPAEFLPPAKKTVYDTANELRIDLLIEILYRNASAQEMHDDLLKLINERINLMDNSPEEKEELVKYMKQYYKMPTE